MRILRSGIPILTIALASAAAAQTTPPPAQTSTPPPLISDRSAYERRELLPSLNLYFPEGSASVRLRKLIRNTLFESQIDYKFVTGDISTYLRYKYYAKNFTYRIAVFDTLGFPQIGPGSRTNEFERVRGGLLLLGFPRDYNHRYFYLLQDDRLTFGDLTNVDNKRNNIYTKLGFQYGTQFDERLNAIVGESRGRITPVLTAFRDIGPQKSSLAAAITESLRISTGDYKYTKVEAEGMRRTDITATSFIFSRLHFGTFLGYEKCKTDVCKGRVNLPEIDRFSIPIYEMFQMGGREALRAVSSTKSYGTQEVHLTNEFFMPVFRNRDFKSWLMHWNTMYGIGYVGVGTTGFRYNQLARSADLVVDAGLGTETALTIRDFEVLLSVLYARTLRSPAELKGSKVRFSVRTVR